MGDKEVMQKNIEEMKERDKEGFEVRNTNLGSLR